MKKNFWTILALGFCPFLFIVLCGRTSGHSQTQLKDVPPQFRKTFQPAELTEDIDFLFQTLEAVHRNLYAYTPKSIIDKEREKFESDIVSPLSRIDFYIKIAPLVAKLRDGHTRVKAPSEEYRRYADSGGLPFPFDLDFRDDKAFIVANYSSDSLIPVGSELLSINGIPIDKIFGRFVQFLSFASVPLKTKIVEVNFRRMLWLVYKFEGQYEIEYIPQSAGGRRTRKVGGVTEKTIREKGGLTSKKEKPPRYAYRSLPAKKIGIIDCRNFLDMDQFKTFLKETFTQIQKDNTESLVIDIRQNGGGDSALGGALLSYITDKPFTQFSRIETKVSKQINKFYIDMAVKRGLIPPDTQQPPLEYMDEKTRKMWSTPEGSIFVSEGEPKARGENPLRFNGKVYVLIGNATFSSAVSFATMVNDYKLGTLVGEETGGLATCYGDSYSFVLPNTKIACYVSYKRFVRPSGEDDGRGVLPDYEVKQKPEDTEKGVDTVMEFTLNLIKESKS